jgi:hypothetical protein
MHVKKKKSSKPYEFQVIEWSLVKGYILKIKVKVF